MAEAIKEEIAADDARIPQAIRESARRRVNHWLRNSSSDLH